MTNTALQPKTLDQRIEEAHDGNMGAMAGLMATRSQIGDANMAKFLDLVPEKGSALWDRFKAWKAGKPEFMGFNHFVAATICPDPSVLFGKK